MCIFWTRKYTLCGCIWDTECFICPKDLYCWGRRIIQLQDTLHTCKECWRRGDKRIYPEHTSSSSSSSQELLIPPRPLTPPFNFNLDPDPATSDVELHPAPAFLLSSQYNCDLSRVCDAVDMRAMKRDYRARRRRTDWYLLEGEWTVPLFLWL